MKLIEIDLLKATKHEHPDINGDDYYLADFGCGPYAGYQK